jgi:ankyrin repeat protein
MGPARAAAGEYPVSRTWRAQWGDTVLHWAAKDGRADICALLVDHGADVDFKVDGPVRSGPAHAAREPRGGLCVSDHDRVTHGQGIRGYTALHHSVQGNHGEAVYALVLRGASCDIFATAYEPYGSGGRRTFSAASLSEKAGLTSVRGAILRGAVRRASRRTRRVTDAEPQRERRSALVDAVAVGRARASTWARR